MPVGPYHHSSQPSALPHLHYIIPTTTAAQPIQHPYDAHTVQQLLCINNKSDILKDFMLDNEVDLTTTTGAAVTQPDHTKRFYLPQQTTSDRPHIRHICSIICTPGFKTLHSWSLATALPNQTRCSSPTSPSVLLLGDFNFHMDSTDSTTTTEFMEILNWFNYFPNDLGLVQDYAWFMSIYACKIIWKDSICLSLFSKTQVTIQQSLPELKRQNCLLPNLLLSFVPPELEKFC